MPYPTKSQLKELSKNAVHRQWLVNYEKLKRFHGEFHRFPTRHETWRGQSIGAWCSRQRQWYRLGTIPLWRYEMLIAAGFELELPDAFKENVKYLGRLWKEHPESWPFIPRKYCVNDYDRLQAWMQDNRKRYINGKLSREQKALLESIRFPLQGKALKWELVLKRFKQWVEKHNRYPKRNNHDKEEISLANWRYCQMQRFREGRLSAEKFKALNSIRSDLIKESLYKKNSWDLMYDELKKRWLKDRGGKGLIPVPKNDVNYGKWYRWFYHTRKSFKAGVLSKEKIKLLEEIGCDFVGVPTTHGSRLPGQ